MKNRRDFLEDLTVAGGVGLISPSLAQSSQKTDGEADRAYWLSVLRRIAHPVLVNLAQRRLRERMPVEGAAAVLEDRRNHSHLEAIGRLLAGIAPWLELGPTVATTEEGRLRTEYAELARQSISAATDPRSPDFMKWAEGRQPLVDGAFLAHALIRARNELWRKLDAKTQRDLVVALKSTRTVKPGFNNWLLFSAMIEAALFLMGERWDEMRVDYAVRQHEQWYKGDGVYGDGPDFHWDYYNSFVIQPMLLDVLRTIPESAKREYETVRRNVLRRAQRYAEIQERLISPEGTFPAVGRSLAYRFGAFQLLGQMALMHELPEKVRPAQVRCALTAVIRRMIEAPGTFDRDGWLRIGFAGHQPSIGEGYISTGSLYLCAVGLLPLGLPPDDEFWNSAPSDWTARKIWSGRDLEADHAISG